VDVTACCTPWLRWVLQLPPAACRTLALTMDAATLGPRCTIRTRRVVIRSSAIPVAWNIIPATAKGAWRPHRERLFGALRGVTPIDWTVIVLADRGLEDRWLFHTITSMGWHPFLRINRPGQYRPAGATDYQPLAQVVRNGGPAWSGRVTCFKTRERQLDGALLARWDAAYAEPWLILTDLPPNQADARWSGMRAGIAGGSKDAKRGGWHWERTKMTDPQRAERLWLVMALATVWVVSVGCAAEVAQPAPQAEASPATRIARQRARGRRARPAHVAPQLHATDSPAPMTLVLLPDRLFVRRRLDTMTPFIKSRLMLSYRP